MSGAVRECLLAIQEERCGAPGGSVAEFGVAGRADLATAKFLRERGQLVNQEFKDHSGHIPGIPVGECAYDNCLALVLDANHAGSAHCLAPSLAHCLAPSLAHCLAPSLAHCQEHRHALRRTHSPRC